MSTITILRCTPVLLCLCMTIHIFQKDLKIMFGHIVLIFKLSDK